MVELTKNKISQQLDDLWDQKRGDATENLLRAQQLCVASLDIDYQLGIFASNIVQAYALQRLEKYTEALYTLEGLADSIQRVPQGKWHVYYFGTYSAIYYKLSIFELAIERIWLAVQTAETLNSEELIARSKATLGVIYSATGDYEKAIEYALSLLDIDETLINWQDKFSAYLNASADYIYTKQPQKAVEAATLALQFAETELTIANAHNNLGSAYTIAGDFDHAKQHLEKAIDLHQQLGNKRHQALVMIDLADYYLALDEHDQAIKMLLSALSMAGSVNDLKSMADCHQRLHTIFRTQQNWEHALHHHEQLHTITSMIFNEDTANRLYNIELIHEMQKLRELNAQQRREYDALTEMKDTLLSNVSHDLKNPISVIKMHLYLANETLKPDQDSPYTRYFDIIESEVARMTHLVTDVLDMARLDTGIALEKHKVNLSKLILDLCDDFQQQAKEKNVTLTCDCHDELHGLVDTVSIERALTNLISNAIKYVKETGNVHISARPEDENTIIIQVKDDGVGIPENELPMIFDRFYRVSTQRDFAEGTGLGLSIVKSIIEQHQGKVDVDSQLGKGTTFNVSIPVA